MKKLISFAIILSVFAYVGIAGFLILKTTITSDTSNFRLIENFLAPHVAPESTTSVARLAEAAANVIKPETAAPLPKVSLQEAAPTGSVGSPPSPIKNIPNTSEAATISEQSLEVLAATLINLQMTTSSK